METAQLQRTSSDENEPEPQTTEAGLVSSEIAGEVGERVVRTVIHPTIRPVASKETPETERGHTGELYWAIVNAGR